MKIRTSTGLVIAVLITCFIVCGIPSTFARPHEELTFEPIEFNPPVPEKRVLSNGMVLYLLEDHELPLFNINGLIKTGDLYDPADKVGLASICAGVMRTGGTVSREPDALNEELESMAASVEVGMSLEYGRVSLSTLTEDTEKGLEIFADVLRNPAFREDKLTLRKQQIIEGIRRRNDNPFPLALRNFSALLYGTDHPFGWYSEIEGVESITVEDLKAFHAKYFHPDNMMLAITGDFDTETLIAQLEKVFEGWEKVTEIAFPDVPIVNEVREPSVNYIFKDLNQTVILLGHLGIKRTPDFPGYFALRVMNDILGEGGFTSRLMREVREKHGLAYAVGSMMQTSYYTNPGEWLAYSQTRADKTAEAIALIIDVVKGLRDVPVPEDELQRTKDSLINSFVFGFESSAQIAFQQMILDYRGYAPDFLETFTDNIAKVTAEDVQAVAQKHLHPDALTIIAVGNKESFDRPLDEFGEVNEIEIEQPAPPPAEPMPEASETDMAKAKEVLAAAVEAHGGLEKLQAVKNAVMEADISANSQAGPMQIDAKLYYLFPDKFRQEMKTPQGEMAYTYDGSAAYAMTPMGVQPIPPQMAASFKDSVFRETVWLLTNLSQNDIPVQYAGAEDVQGKPASILVVPQPSGEMLRLFISDETHYVVKYAYQETSQGVTANRETLMDDYRDVDGIKIAHRTVQNVEGQRFSEIRVKSVTLNAELDASLFQEPE